MKLVTLDRLAEKLKVARNTPGKWHRAGLLSKPRVINHTPHYFVESVDELLRRGTVNRRVPVTAVEVLWGETTLLTLQEASDRLGLDDRALTHRLQRGTFPGVKLSKIWRIVESDVDAALGIGDRQSVTRKEAAHIFGSSLQYIEYCVKRKDLHCVEPELPTKGSKPISMESILSFVRKLAPRWVDPQAWVAERREDTRPLMTQEELAHFLGIHIGSGGEILRAKKGAFLQINSNLVKISPVSAGKILLTQDRLTIKQVAGVFGQDEATVRRAWEAGDLKCTLHHHLGNELRQGCIVNMLRTCLSPGIAYEIRWFKYRIKNPEPLLSVAQAATRFKISEEEVIRRIQNGKLRAVKLPSPHAEWRISKTAN